jgi:mono/diheme cytochrome c family protein
MTKKCALSPGSRGFVAAACGLTLLLAGCVRGVTPAGDDAATLGFSVRGGAPSTKTLAELKAVAPVETVTAFDPYYQRPKTWRALPLDAVLKAAFPGEPLDRVDFVLTAADGYTVPVSGARLMEGGAYLAFADADGPWQPIGAKGAWPGPWYLVWTGEAQQNPVTHPRPWALARIAIARFEDVFPKVVPPVGDALVQRGFELFRNRCLSCHAVNQQGGTVGPELNVPKNVTEYRDEAFLRAWIRNPFAFRVSVMPPSPDLSDGELDALLAYLRAMATAKVPVAFSAGH